MKEISNRLSIWKERVDKVIILNPSSSFQLFLESLVKLEILPKTFSLQLLITNKKNMTKKLKKFMKSELFLKQYGGKKSKSPSNWPPDFNSNYKEHEISDIFFLKVEYGIRPYFQNTNDYQLYNKLNRRLVDTDLLKCCKPENFKEISVDDLKRKMGEFRFGQFCYSGTLGYVEQERSKSKSRRKDAKIEEKKEPGEVVKKKKKGGFLSIFGCAGER